MTQNQLEHLFDNLPLDMIQFEIFPYLDYDSRVTVNLMLPRQDRIRTPLKKDSALKFAIHMSALQITKMIGKVDAAKGNPALRNRYLLKVFRTLPKYFFILEYNNKARNAILEKCAEYVDRKNLEFTNASPHLKKTLPGLCQAIIDMAEVRPLIRDLPYIDKDVLWTPLKNANDAEVVSSTPSNIHLDRSFVSSS
jgi:hypothetical protein